MVLTLNNVNDILSNTQSMIERLTSIKLQISENFKQLQGSSVSKMKIQSEIRDMKDEQQKYDSLFEEEESTIQAMGGRTRMQTLQEFVLTFFYTGFVLISLSIAIYYYIRTGGSKKEVFKVIGLMIFIGLVITGLIIRLS